MINASELRLWNIIIVEYKGKELYSTITSICEANLECRFERQEDLVNGVITSDKLIKPISLIEEWLLSFGFEKKDKVWNDKSITKDLFFKGDYFVQFSKEGILFCQLHYSGTGWFVTNIKYVHQLQNLYLALTGEELTLNK